MKNNCKVEIRLSEDMLRKLLAVSRREGRSVNNQFLFLLRNNIQYYERTHGRLTAADLAAEDITPYLPDESEDGEK